MGNFVIEGFKYIYEDEKEREILLDLEDWFSNFGRVPFHDYFDNKTVSTLILENLEEHSKYCKNYSHLSEYEVTYALMDVVFIREHTRSKYPKNIAEFGAENRIVQNHIENILLELQPKSQYCKCNNDCDNDIVIINATERKDSWEEIIEEALSCMTSGGLLIALCIGQDNMYESMVRRFHNSKIYRVDDSMLWKIRK